MLTKRLLPVVLGLAVFPAMSLAQDTQYIDDRSSVSAIVRSLYNAVNSKQYARAWSYYGDTKPAANLQAYAAGYKDTASIELAFGRAESEGAAGSIFYSLPVAIQAASSDGSTKVFAGCYTARLANPQIQDANFIPLHIEKGELKPSEKPLAEAVPANCGGGEKNGEGFVLPLAKTIRLSTKLLRIPTVTRIASRG